jgi:hypothetical protein
MELIERLRGDLSARLRAQGWIARERAGAHDVFQTDADEIETFSQPLREEFSAVAMFAWVHEDQSDETNVVGGLGIEYGPARALLERLTGSEIFCAMLSRTNVVVSIREGTEVPKVSEKLAQFVVDEARELEKLADIDRVIDLLNQRRALPFAAHMAGFYAMDVVDSEPDGPEFSDVPSDEVELTAALLAGAGRYGEARHVLAETRELHHALQDHRRFVRQLTRLLDAEGSLSLPATPPRWPPGSLTSQSPPNSLQLLTASLPEGMARREAINAVRVVSSGKTRHELRSLLEIELSKRCLSIDRRSAEAMIDLLATEQRPLGNTRIALRGLNILLSFWRKRPPEARAKAQWETAALKPASVPDLEPALLARPDRAAYPLGYHSSLRRATIDLDPRACAWLDCFADRSVVEIWLTSDSESSLAATRLNVNIGVERVGQLGAGVANCFRPAMEAAAEREEAPWTYAYLTATFGATPYVLTVGLPGTADSDVA